MEDNMISIRKSGTYKLIETKRHTKILYLGPVAYAWIEPTRIGVILVTTHNVHNTDCVLSTGHFRLYDVDQEPQLSDNQHLELEVFVANRLAQRSKNTQPDYPNARNYFRQSSLYSLEGSAPRTGCCAYVSSYSG